MVIYVHHTNFAPGTFSIGPFSLQHCFRQISAPSSHLIHHSSQFFLVVYFAPNDARRKYAGWLADDDGDDWFGTPSLMANIHEGAVREAFYGLPPPTTAPAASLLVVCCWRLQPSSSSSLAVLLLLPPAPFMPFKSSASSLPILLLHIFFCCPFHWCNNNNIHHG